MRTIKFRAWNGKKFIQPSTSKEYGICIFSGDLFAGYTDSNNGVSWMDNCSLTQFTGLHDKNGNEIYEGDVLKFPCEVLEPCDIGTYDFFSVVFKDGSFRMHDGDDLYGWNEDSEVIGNIYENPELIKP